MGSLIENAGFALEDRIRRILARRFGINVERWRFRWSPLRGMVELTDVALRGEAPLRFHLVAQLVFIHVQLGSLLRPSIHLREISILEPRLEILGRKTASASTRSSTPSSKHRGLIIDRANISRATVKLSSASSPSLPHALQLGPMFIELERCEKSFDYHLSCICEGLGGQNQFTLGEISLDLTLRNVQTLGDLVRSAISASIHLQPTAAFGDQGST